ncbi:MAG: hypothetical protein E6P95_01055 [Candidatus Moraniibacteriota bacterium]|nr:MAG: hypothetical protein E6P95_01055 [Candidatus Moranbacteria bacterium]
MKKYLLFIIFYTFFSLIHASMVSAAAGFSINPPVNEILLAPNKRVNTTIQLTNESDSETTVILSLHKIFPSDNLGHTTIDPKPIDLTAIPLTITISKLSLNTPLTLPPHSTLPVPITLESASLDKPTDVYLALLARSIEANKTTPSVSTSHGITSLLLTTITPLPAIPTDVALTLPTLPSLHDSFLPLPILIEATNKSTNMLQLKGTLTLTSPRGKTLKQISLEPTLILGSSTRLLLNSPQSFAITDIGPYTIKVSLLTAGDRELVSNTSVVWIIPLRGLIMLVVTAIILTILKIRYSSLTTRQEKA